MMIYNEKMMTKSVMWMFLVGATAAAATTPANGVVTAATADDNTAAIGAGSGIRRSSSSTTNVRRRQLTSLGDIWESFWEQISDSSTDITGDGNDLIEDITDVLGIEVDFDVEELVNENLDNIDFSMWEAWLESFIDNTSGGGDSVGLSTVLDILSDDTDICDIAELAIGMTEEFLDDASCKCTGSLQSGDFDIECAVVDQCIGGSGNMMGDGPGDGNGDGPGNSDGQGLCGTVKLDFAFGADGIINAKACADVQKDDFEQLCFSYEIDMGSGDGNGVIKQTCAASYGGNSCGCAIDDLCLAVDCSNFFPEGGGTINTCEILGFTSEKNNGDAGADTVVKSMLRAFPDSGEEAEPVVVVNNKCNGKNKKKCQRTPGCNFPKNKKLCVKSNNPCHGYNKKKCGDQPAGCKFLKNKKKCVKVKDKNA